MDTITISLILFLSMLSPFGAIFLIEKIKDIVYTKRGFVCVYLITANSQKKQVWIKKEGNFLKDGKSLYPFPKEQGYKIFGGIFGNSLELYYDQNTRQPINFKFDTISIPKYATDDKGNKIKDDTTGGYVENENGGMLLEQRVNTALITKSDIDNVYSLGEIQGRLESQAPNNTILYIITAGIIGIGAILLLQEFR